MSTKISVLKEVQSFAPDGWQLTLNTQSLPVEIIRQHYMSDHYDVGVRVWVDSPDLGNANVNLYRGGRVEISLSSVMNKYTAKGVLSYQEIVNRVKESSSQVTADIDALLSARALEIRGDGIIIMPGSSNYTNSRKQKGASQRLTQAIVDFLQQKHSDVPVNREQNLYYAEKHHVQKEIAHYIQSQFGAKPSTETADVYESKNLLDPQENRPAFYSRYFIYIKGIGEVSMLLGNDDYSPVGFKWLKFKLTKKGDVLPSENKILEILGKESSPYIERIFTNSSGELQLDFFTDSRGANFEVARQMVFRLVNALKEGLSVDSSAIIRRSEIDNREQLR